jgi:hypothetical protein
MSAFYTGLANTALRLIKDKGQPLELVSVETDFNPVTGKKGWNIQPNKQEVFGVIFPTSNDQRGSAVQTSELVKSVTIEIVLEAKSLTTAPQATDVVVVGGENWQIMTIDTLSPAGVDIIHTLKCQKNAKTLI